MAFLVLLPLGALLGLGLAAIWLIWLAVSTLQAALLRLRVDDRRIRTHVPLRHHPAPPRAGLKRTAELPLRRQRSSVPAVTPGHRRHSVEDVQRSISAMARHGWPKSKVIPTLEAAGAAWMWSERVASEEAAARARAAVPGERVHLRYRPGDSVFERYTMPAARIDVYFDQAGRLVGGSAHQDRRM